MIHTEPADKLEIRYNDTAGFRSIRPKILDALLLEDGPVFVRIYPRIGTHTRYNDSGQASFLITRQKDGRSYILSEFLCIREYIEVRWSVGEIAPTREDFSATLNWVLSRYLGF